MTVSHSVAARSPLPELCVLQDTTKKSSSSRCVTYIVLLLNFMNSTNGWLLKKLPLATGKGSEQAVYTCRAAALDTQAAQQIHAKTSFNFAMRSNECCILNQEIMYFKNPL